MTSLFNISVFMQELLKCFLFSTNHGIYIICDDFDCGNSGDFNMQGSDTSKPSACEPCLDLIPESHSLLKARKLEEEGKQAFEVLMSYQSSQHISRFSSLIIVTFYRIICKVIST